MSLRANIDHLSAAQGIVAVSVVTADQPILSRGLAEWSPVLDASVALMAKTTESSIRLVIGTHTVVVQTEGAETVAVVLPTGHAVAKSLRRMIRRMSRKVRAPLVAAEPHVAPTTPAASPVAGPIAPAASQSQSKMDIGAVLNQPSPTWG